MSSIFKSPHYLANRGKNGFDMGTPVPFTSFLSALIPCYYEVLNPGEKIRFRADFFTRSEPLVKPAMTSIKECVDWFFVPFEQVYTPFKSMFDGIDDRQSSMFDRLSLNRFPNANLKDFLSEIYEVGSGTANNQFQFKSKATQLDLMGMPNFYGACRLFQHLGQTTQGIEAIVNHPGYSTPVAIDVLHDIDSSITFPLFPFAAYQKIYSDYYRLDNYMNNKPEFYNLDKYYNSVVNVSALIGNENAETPYSMGMFSMHYIPWKKDYFTNIVPAPLFAGLDDLNQGAAGGIVENNYALNTASVSTSQWLTPNAMSVLFGMDDPKMSRIPTTLSATSAYTGVWDRGTFSPSNLRAMFAAEKLLEVTRRNGKTYDQQTLGHFGVRVPKGLSGRVWYLGTDETTMVFDAVVSTADTTDGALGDMAGKGVVSAQSKIKDFEAPCHGLVMAIHYMRPEAHYSAADSMDKQLNIHYPVDFYRPEYDELGMQPLFAYEQQYYCDGAVISNPADKNARILGWQYRYSQYKTKPSRVYGRFLYGDGRTWIPTRPIGEYSTMVQRLHVSPEYFDNLFETQTGGWIHEFGSTMYAPDSPVQTGDPIPVYSPGQWCYRDQFQHYLNIQCWKTSEMSTYGLPNL